MTIASLLRQFVLALGLLAVLAGGALAQSEPKRSPFGVGPGPSASERGLTAGRPAVAAPAEDLGFLDRAWAWAVDQQRRYSREMATAVKQMRTEPFGPAFLSLVFLSFVYGVLHAAGPGHGKFVISSYALATGETVRRGVMMSFLAAFFQALSAIFIFLVLALVLGATKQRFDQTEAWLETISWALVAAAGAYLLYSQLRPMHSSGKARAPASAARAHDHSHHPHHDHAHGHGHAAHGPTSHGHASHGHASHGHHAHVHVHGHEHTHDHAAHPHTPQPHTHGDDCGCGHGHVPTPDQLQGAWSWRRAVVLAASVGIRPCSGALIVLAFALFNGILWAGVLATFAMALGTAITVSALAAMAVGMRDLTARMTGPGDAWADRAMSAAGIVGASLVLVMGGVFFLASLRTVAPF